MKKRVLLCCSKNTKNASASVVFFRVCLCSVEKKCYIFVWIQKTTDNSSLTWAQSLVWLVVNFNDLILSSRLIWREIEHFLYGFFFRQKNSLSIECAFFELFFGMKLTHKYTHTQISMQTLLFVDTHWHFLSVFKMSLVTDCCVSFFSLTTQTAHKWSVKCWKAKCTN